MTPSASSDTLYFRQRESQERRLADVATDRAVRRVHLAMAERYARLSIAKAAPYPPTA